MKGARKKPNLQWLTGVSPEDTFDKCTDVVRFVGNAVNEMHDLGISQGDGYAVFMILNSVADALDWAKEEQFHVAQAARSAA